MITAEEGTNEGTEALHHTISKGRCHNKEMSPNKRWDRMTHLACGKAQLEEASDPWRWATIMARTPTVKPSVIVATISHHKQQSRRASGSMAGKGDSRLNLPKA
jgi:hypothetical protein